MKFSDGISMSARDIRRRKLRSILTIIAIAVGTMLLVAMQGIGTSITNTTNSFIESFGNMNEVMVLPQKYNANANFATQFQGQSQSSNQILPYTPNVPLNPKEENNTKPITNDTLENLSKIADVQKLSAYEASKVSSVNIESVNKTGGSSVILGYDKNFDYKQEGKVVAGTTLTGASNEFLVKESYIKDMGITDYNSVVGKKITLTVKMPYVPGMPEVKPLTITGTIKGVYTEKNAYSPGNIITLSNITNEINAYYQGKSKSDVKANYSMVTLDVNSQSEIPAIVKSVNKNLGYSTFYLGEIIGFASIFTGFVGSILDIAAIIVIAVAAIGLANTMTMTIQEKRKWIGIMRSLGATKGNISLIFLVQSLILGIIGGIVGCIVAAIGIEGINMWLSATGKDFTISLTSNNLGLGFIVAIIVSLLAGYMPSRRAAKMDVVETINEE